MNSKAMDVRRVGGVIIYVILLCALATGSSEGKRRTPGTFYGDGVGRKSPEIDKDKAEQLWINCKQELMDMKGAIADFDLYFSQEAFSGSTETNSKATALRKQNIHKAISGLPLQVKQTLLACLRKKNQQSSISGKIIKYFEPFFGSTNAPGRNLLGNVHQKIAPTPGPAPAPARVRVPAPAPALESPSHGPAPSYSAPASSPSPNSQPPINAPKQPPVFAFYGSVSPPPSSKHSPPRPHVSPYHTPQKHNDNHGNDQKTHLVIVTAAAVGALFLSALLLFCCLRGSSNKIGLRDGQKDERPLLFSMSDLSACSSQKSQSLGNSSNQEYGSNSGKIPSFGGSTSIMSHDIHDSSAGIASSSEASAATALPPLKPPPGRVVPPPPKPPPPPPPAAMIAAPRPPPPPKGARPPPAPPKPRAGSLGGIKPAPLGAHQRGDSTSSEGDPDAPKAKLKPFFWDKVLANPDHSMVWHEIKAGSFQFNEEMIESLFGYAAMDKNKNERKKESSSSLEALPQYIQIIDSKKAQNLSILLRALNVTTEEVCDALREGNELPVELLQTLLKMAPTTDEELKLRLFSGDPSQLGPAERFLKVLVEIPFAFKRLESLLFMSFLQEEIPHVKVSFATLEVACKKLRNSRLFLKLLEAVLKTGNRMNDGTFRGGAQAFKLDTLLKLSDVKGIDGKTTLLHFVVQEIIRSEGVRAARTAKESRSFSSLNSEDLVETSTQESAEHYRSLGLQVVSGLSTELEDVKKAAAIDVDGLAATVSRLGSSLIKARDFLNSDMKNLEEDSEFHRTLASFVGHAEREVTWLLEEEKRIMALVKSTADYFHGNAGKDEGLRLFAIVRDFLIILDKVCREVKNLTTNPIRIPKKEGPGPSDSPDVRQQHLPDIHQRLFPAIVDRRMDNSSSDSSSSDDESPFR